MSAEPGHAGSSPARAAEPRPELGSEPAREGRPEVGGRAARAPDDGPPFPGAPPGAGAVRRVEALPAGALAALAARYAVRVVPVAPGEPIPGSHWGEPEAGLAGDRLYVRPDTPVHSALHELCHYVCMDEGRRAGLDTDAGGDYDEENGVCWLSVALAERLPGFGRERMLADMDAWGYTFRLGSARAWWEHDADDALAWLRGHGLVDAAGRPRWRVRR